LRGHDRLFTIAVEYPLAATRIGRLRIRMRQWRNRRKWARDPERHAPKLDDVI
jgi:hypothetical protein